MITYHEIRHAHFFCGLGGGARGFNQGEARLGNLQARFRCLGGIDVDSAAIRDFERLSGLPGTVLDLFNREQYRAFHGVEPPKDWREAVPADIHRAFRHQRPHIVFLSAPCKGFSGLLSEGKSQSARYQALNGLTLRGIWLMLEAYRDDPPELLLFENVPRIATRGRHLLDQIIALLRSYGYAVAETTHDCGQLGGLAQSRKRFLLVARHAEKVPSFLYEPTKRPLRAVGDVLGRMPLPGAPAGGPMHRIPRLQWKTWVRLAFVAAGSDWRSLNRLAVENGILRDYGIVPERVWHDDALGVLPWSGTLGTVTGKSSPTSGRFAVADPRALEGMRNDSLGVIPFDEPCGVVTSRGLPLNGRFSVADPRIEREKHKNVYRVVEYNSPCGTVVSGHSPSNGGGAVADPRPDWMMQPGRESDAYENIYRIVPFADPCKAVTGASHTAGGALSVADPRPTGCMRSPGDHFYTAGNYGVLAWEETSGTIKAAACHDNGYCSIADPRLPEASENCLAVIRALDGTWHRPFTTLELAALQGLLDPEEYLELDGLSDSAWRERIGNAVPPPAAAAVAGVMGQVLLLTWAGETFPMSSTPIWVRPAVVGLMAARVGV